MKHILFSVAGLSILLLACTGGIEPQVVNGDPADWKDFPATCSFKSAGKPNCTCVIVGPRTLLTAAHCMKKHKKGKTVKGTIRVFDKSGDQKVDCFRADNLDLAACHVAAGIVKDIPFEGLNNLPLNPQVSTLLLTGFGCTEPSEVAEQGTLNKGEAIVDSLPGDRIKLGQGNSSLCPGDSGGPGYILLSNNPLGPRLVAGINAMNFHLTNVNTTSARAFICDVAGKSTPICGCPSAPATGCR